MACDQRLSAHGIRFSPVSQNPHEPVTHGGPHESSQFVHVAEGGVANRGASQSWPFPDRGTVRVLLHGCGGDPEGLDRNWGARLQSWGYVSLTVDSFGPRGITNSCQGGEVTGRDLDAYAALQFLTERTFVIPSQVAIMGFSEGGIVTLNANEPRKAEQPVPLKFQDAIAIYPLCAGSGIVTVPTLILNGQLDDWSSAEACRKMVARESDIGITRHDGVSAPIRLVILPGAYHKFDDPKFQPGRRYRGHLLEYNPAALMRAADDVHAFLRAQSGTP